MQVTPRRKSQIGSCGHDPQLVANSARDLRQLLDRNGEPETNLDRDGTVTCTRLFDGAFLIAEWRTSQGQDKIACHLSTVITASFVQEIIFIFYFCSRNINFEDDSEKSLKGVASLLDSDNGNSIPRKRSPHYGSHGRHRFLCGVQGHDGTETHGVEECVSQP